MAASYGGSPGEVPASLQPLLSSTSEPPPGTAGAIKAVRKPPLHRNQACAACKRKKRKCDAIRPICGPCQNSAKLYQEEPRCEWSGPVVAAADSDASYARSAPTPASTASTPSERPRKQIKLEVSTSDAAADELASLKTRIAELEAALQLATVGSRGVGPGGQGGGGPFGQPTPPLTAASSYSSPRSNVDNLPLGPAPPSNAVARPLPSPRAFPVPEASHTPSSVPIIVDQSTTQTLGPGLSVLQSGWAADLPPLNIVKPLARAALALITDILFILPLDNFFHSLALPATDPRFPSPGLLHALCALGAAVGAMPNGTQPYWRSDEVDSPAKYHFRRARQHLSTIRISSVLDDTRAVLLLTVYSFASENFIDVWQLVGQACRNVAPVGLNVRSHFVRRVGTNRYIQHIQNHSALPSSKMGVSPGLFLRKPTFVSQPINDYDVFYRTTLMWQLYCCDVWMSACSGWSPALHVDDITTLLPVWPSDASPLDIVLNQPSLDVHSPLFFTVHLESPILSLHLSIKSMLLLSKATIFLQRSTLPDATSMTLEAKERIRGSHAFKEIEKLIVSYQNAIPQSCLHPLRVMADGRLDANLINAHIVPSVAYLLLYEPFIYGSDQDEGFQRSLEEATKILRVTQAIYAHSGDSIAYYYTQINYCWMVANRTLIRALRFMQDKGDIEGAANHREHVQFLLNRITPLSKKSPLVGSCLEMLDSLIRNESDWHMK